MSTANQQKMSADPFEIMLMQMGNMADVIGEFADHVVDDGNEAAAGSNQFRRGDNDQGGPDAQCRTS